jgi:hypothetical protein
MLAREQLEFVEDLVGLLERPSNALREVLSLQALHVSVVTMLRAVGHTFESIDCDTPQKSQWAKSAWKEWQKEAIFADFIKPTRDNLLKEFRGKLTVDNSAFGLHAVYADPSARSGATIVGDFRPANFRDEYGDPVMPKLRQAIAFWKRRLNEAEVAFRSFEK